MSYGLISYSLISHWGIILHSHFIECMQKKDYDIYGSHLIPAIECENWLWFASLNLYVSGKTKNRIENNVTEVVSCRNIKYILYLGVFLKEKSQLFHPIVDAALTTNHCQTKIWKISVNLNMIIE